MKKKQPDIEFKVGYIKISLDRRHRKQYEFIFAILRTIGQWVGTAVGLAVALKVFGVI